MTQTIEVPILAYMAIRLECQWSINHDLEILRINFTICHMNDNFLNIHLSYVVII